MSLKQDSVHFVICPKQGNEIEGIVLNRVCILGMFCPVQGQGFKLSAAHLYPNIGGGRGGGLVVRQFYSGVGGNEGDFISKSCTRRGKWDLVKEKVKNMKTIVQENLGSPFFSCN